MIESIHSKLDMTGCLESRQGGRTENQDFAGVAETPFGTLIVVCDGMGGMKGGSTASRLAVTSILEYYQNADRQENPSMLLVKAIQSANAVVWEAGNQNPDLQGMGTTVTALLLNENCAIVAHVGDSRIYQLRNGKKVFRSFDHSMVFEMVKKKVITEEQARLSAQSNIIMKALGIKSDVEVNTHQLTYRKGDRFILCTDGFWGVMPEEEFIDLVSNPNAIEKVLESSCNTVEAVARKKGSDYDNLTAAVIEMHRDSIIKPQMNNTAKIIIAVLAALLLVSVAFNIFGTSKEAPSASVYCGAIDSVRVVGNSTVIYLPSKIKGNLTDTTSVIITTEKK